jgi:hypothetical protein
LETVAAINRVARRRRNSLSTKIFLRWRNRPSGSGGGAERPKKVGADKTSINM